MEMRKRIYCSNNEVNEGPKVTDTDFYDKYKEYEYLVKSLNIPKGLKVFEVVCPPRIVGYRSKRGYREEREGNSQEERDVLHNMITLSESDLHADLNCLICFSILRKTMVVKDCMHRFCCECIEKCVRMGLRECPRCRLHIPSRRALRNDEIMDALTFRLFPKAVEFEERYQELLVERNKRQRAGQLLDRTEGIPLCLNGLDNNGHASAAVPLVNVSLKPFSSHSEGICGCHGNNISLGTSIHFRLKLPLYVSLEYLKQYVLGRIRHKEKGANEAEKYGVRLYISENEKSKVMTLLEDGNLKIESLFAHYGEDGGSITDKELIVSYEHYGF